MIKTSSHVLVIWLRFMADSATLMDKAVAEVEAPALGPSRSPGVADTLLYATLPCYASAVASLLFAAKVMRT